MLIVRLIVNRAIAEMKNEQVFFQRMETKLIIISNLHFYYTYKALF